MFISYEAFDQFKPKILSAESDSGGVYTTWVESVRSHGGFNSFTCYANGYFIDDIEYTWFVLRFL